MMDFQDIQKQQEAAQQMAQLENAVKMLMTKEALSRFGNVKTAYPDRAMQTVIYFAQLVQTGKIKEITDDQLKSVLLAMDRK